MAHNQTQSNGNWSSAAPTVEAGEESNRRSLSRLSPSLILEAIQTADAADASPAHLPVGPQNAAIQQRIVRAVRECEWVKETAIQQTTRDGYGPLEIVFFAEDHPQAREGVSNIACTESGDLPGGIVGRVRDDPYRPPRTAPCGGKPAGSLLVWQHPLIPHIRLAVSGQATFYWKAEADSLSIGPALNLSDQPPLYGWVTYRQDGDQTVEAISDQLFSKVPRKTCVDVESVARSMLPEAASPPKGCTGFAVTLSRNDKRESQQSGVFCVDGEVIPGAIDKQTDRGETELAQLTITSPPYLDVIDYEVAAESDDDYNSTSGSDSLPIEEIVEEWKQTQRAIFDSIYEATADGGICAVVISHVKTADTYVPLPHEFADVMQDVGFEFYDRIIWSKTTSGSGRFGTTIQSPSGNYYPNHMHEEIQIWGRGDMNRSAEPLAKSEVVKSELANDVWHMAPVPPGESKHPCPFSEELVHRLTLLYSAPGDIVLDPFTGSGSVPFVADRLDRIGIGTELEQSFADSARQRLRYGEYTRTDPVVPDHKKIDANSDEGQYVQADTDDEDTAQSSLGAF